MSFNQTPRSNRLHIGVFGRTNSGKSSLINHITHQEVSIVSPVAGTTTDPVYKAMEIHPLGPCVFIDTAGFQDQSELGKNREEKTKQVIDKIDIALLLFEDKNIQEEKKWYQILKTRHIPTICLLSKTDIRKNVKDIQQYIQKNISDDILLVSTKNKQSIDIVKEALMRKIPEDFGIQYITGELVSKDDLVLLVMPQDIQAPKGRLILPQVQTLRELLDKKCIIMSTTTDQYIHALQTLKYPPKLIITDSQVFDYVYEHKPTESLLTSFSVLFAGYKGDITYYKKGAKTIASLQSDSHILIAECCTHAPLQEDIGRVKIPRMLKNKYGIHHIDIVSGTDFPEDLSSYDLIIQCGGCMFNRQYILSRIERAKNQNVPMTNYGMTIAYIQNILDKVSFND